MCSNTIHLNLSLVSLAVIEPTFCRGQKTCAWSYWNRLHLHGFNKKCIRKSGKFWFIQRQHLSLSGTLQNLQAYHLSVWPRPFLWCMGEWFVLCWACLPRCRATICFCKFWAPQPWLLERILPPLQGLYSHLRNKRWANSWEPTGRILREQETLTKVPILVHLPGLPSMQPISKICTLPLLPTWNPNLEQNIATSGIALVTTGDGNTSVTCTCTQILSNRNSQCVLRCWWRR